MRRLNTTKDLYSAEYRRMSPSDRWHANAIHSKTGCWIWRGRPDKNGYGHLKINGRGVKAHRYGYELLVGPIPDGMQLDHLCRNRLCVNPTHLEPVTSRENTLRGQTLAASQAAQTHCIHGHPLFGENLRMCGRKRVCRTCNSTNAKRWRSLRTNPNTGPRCRRDRP